MLIDGISLVDSSVIANTHIESGSAFPTSATTGRMFFLHTANGGDEPGLYVYNGTSWVTGDITKITVGSGLTGGGAKGDISLGIDTAIIATKTYADSVAAVVQADVDSLTKADIGLDLVENKSSATIRSELSSTNVTTALGFTPYNATNPSSYINLTQARQGIGAGTGISYDSTTGFVSLNATTSNIAEGTSLYYTDARARLAISATGSLAYDNTTGVISYTAPTTGTGSGDFKSDGSVAMTGSVKAVVGTNAAPAISFNANGNSGIFGLGTGVAIAASGSTTLTIAADKVTAAQKVSMADGFTITQGTALLAKDPATAMEAATKQYVDNVVGGNTVDGGSF